MTDVSGTMFRNSLENDSEILASWVEEYRHDRLRRPTTLAQRKSEMSDPWHEMAIDVATCIHNRFDLQSSAILGPN